MSDHPRHRGTDLLMLGTVPTRTRATTLRASGGRMATSPPCTDTPHCDQCGMYPDLVERLVKATSELNATRRVLRDLARQEGDPSLAALLVCYQAELDASHANIKRLVNEREKAA